MNISSSSSPLLLLLLSVNKVDNNQVYMCICVCVFFYTSKSWKQSLSLNQSCLTYHTENADFFPCHINSNTEKIVRPTYNTDAPLRRSINTTHETVIIII